MEQNSIKKKEYIKNSVDLSSELSAEELKRFRAGAALSGQSLKAYGLDLIFGPMAVSPTKLEAKKYSEQKKEKES